MTVQALLHTKPQLQKNKQACFLEGALLLLLANHPVKMPDSEIGFFVFAEACHVATVAYLMPAAAAFGPHCHTQKNRNQQHQERLQSCYPK